MEIQAKKKVLFLITKSSWGGAQRYVHDLALSLKATDYDVIVALGGEGPLVTKLKDADIQVIPIPSLQRDISLRKEIKSFWEIYRILRLEKPDIFHINSSKAGGIGAIVGRLARVPRIIFTSHAWAFNERRPVWQKPILKLLHWLTVLCSDHTITVTEALKTQMNWPLAARKMTTVNNGRPAINFLNTADARAALLAVQPQLAACGNITWTGSIGELHPVKRHDVMIEAVAELVAAGHKLCHIIIGSGEIRAELESLIEKHQLSDRVFLLGAIDEAARYIKAFDIYVQPSRSEALPYTVIEAAQAGLPIIATRVGGLSEIITHESNGLLIPAEDTAALTKALLHYLSHPEEAQQHAKNAATSSQKFSITAMRTGTESIYASIAS